MEELKGLIFDVKKFAVNDGPGIRTTVFFKGCPLSCWWCHNPEALEPNPELVFFAEQCIGCGECFKACPQGAHEILPDGTRTYRREACVLCGQCVEVCYAEALVMQGRQVGVEELMVELRRDIPFYENSDGGITLSGGEATLQHEFALALLKQCKAEKLHTALDTSGQIPWRILRELLPYVDYVLYDLKHIDWAEHKKYTGAGNGLILKNLVQLGECGVPIEVRMPIIPGVNDAREDVLRGARFLSEVEGIELVKLLPYHGLGEAKYARLSRQDQRGHFAPPPREQMQEIGEWVRSCGLEVCVGS